MIFDISDDTFKKVLNDQALFLPIRWEGADFSVTLNNLFNHYIRQLENLVDDHRSSYNYVRVDLKEINKFAVY